MESKKVSAKKRLKEYVIITFAAALYGFASSIFIDANDIAPGGVYGLAVAINRLCNFAADAFSKVGNLPFILDKIKDFEPGTWFVIMNIPLLILAVWKFGIRFTISTIYATFIIGVSSNFTKEYLASWEVHDVILAVTFGSALTAIAMGFVFKCHATSGGTDIIIKVLRIKYPHIKTGMLYILTDVFVLAFAGIVMQDVKIAMYSFISVMVTSLTLDFVLYGRDGAKLIYIISDHPDIITARLLEELDIGATHVFAQGAYSGEKKKVIMCAIKKRLSPLAEEIVRDEDPNAFMIVTSASEIFGEGYKSYFDERM